MKCQNIGAKMNKIVQKWQFWMTFYTTMKMEVGISLNGPNKWFLPYWFLIAQHMKYQKIIMRAPVHFFWVVTTLGLQCLTSSLSAAIELLLLVLLPSSSSHRRHRCCTVQKSFTRARTPMPPGRGLASFRAATRNLPMLKRPLAAAHIMRGAAWPIFPFFKRSIYYYILYTIPCTSAK